MVLPPLKVVRDQTDYFFPSPLMVFDVGGAENRMFPEGTHTHTLTYIHIHTHMHAYIYIYVCVCVHFFMNVICTYINIYMYSCALLTYINIYIYM